MSVAEVTNQKVPPTAEEKRAFVRAKFAELARVADGLSDEEIESAHRALLKMEIDRLWRQIGEEAQRDWEEGRLDPAEIEKSIKEFRARHPYR